MIVSFRYTDRVVARRDGTKMTRPRVLITYPYPLGQATGGARMTREIARYLGRGGADVTLMPISATPWSFLRRRHPQVRFLGYEYDEELGQDSVSIERLRPSRLHWIRDGVVAGKAVDRILRRERVDLVLSYFTEAPAVGKVARARGVPFGVISTVQSYGRALELRKRGVPKFLHDAVNRRVVVDPVRRADVIFATSEFTRWELVELMGIDESKIVVCHLGVGPRFFEIEREVPAAINRFLFVGRVVRHKGILDAIGALGRFAAQGHDDWTYRIFGHGAGAWLLPAIREHGLESRIEVHEALLSDDALCAQLQWAQLAILPSHFEAFGLAFAEAQAAGLPVVAYDAGSVPEVVEHGVTGWLAPVHDEAGLARCLEIAVRDPAVAHRAGLAGRERVRRLFSWERTANAMARGARDVCGVVLAPDDGVPSADKTDKTAEG